MPQKISSRQHEILEQLLENRTGLSVDALAAMLDISRTAVQQHFVALEGEGYIKKTASNKTAGRPVAIYGITDKGINYFPKQYAWFAELIVSDLQEGMGEEAFGAYMQRLGGKLADKLKAQFVGKAPDGRLRQLLRIMAELGFQVQQEIDTEAQQPVIKARNCIYHDVARQYPALCQFDLTLMSSLLAKEVQQLGCMAKGDCVCRFRIGKD
ncbi:helix-turn-helix transcriptional regulator [Methylovulum miyakonense]|uniref:helix-turn-helix transcriptional regulator n=1 Tax=Methylovulum miyakonense TaxID=645578 RepID=UPI000364CB77|nr:HTH domain-containing protein [Methylovulum miyakonense]